MAECKPAHDWFSDLLTTGLIVGLFISYAPQHLRIINKGSSEGFSPWFLLLGSTSAASGMLNMIIMQWGVLKCCNVYSAGDCLETIGGVLQVAAQWFLFTIILVLYMIYYPPHLKYATVSVDMHDTRPPESIKTNIKSDSWQLSIILSWVVLIHVVFITFVSFILISTSPSDPTGTVRSDQLALWATFLGVSSGLLAALQYAPQLIHTYRLKLVGALSIPMMMIQSPGGIVMIVSIILRPGTNWTTWIQFIVAAVMQACLLGMCITWKVRQHKLGIDDFGEPLDPPSPASTVVSPLNESATGGPVLHTPDDGASVQEAVEDAVGEQMPLLGTRKGEQKKSWWERLVRR
ncbi:hypothetical protein OF83DRAFT_1129072 [Amylostereum chailletii]|nr:hypothetical protein OF83DRAFT_1129072 [Amylostereum chailletii]